MSKVWSQLAQSKSIAANFESKKWHNHLVTPLEKFAGQDLLKIHSENLEKGSEERKKLKAKKEASRASKAPPIPTPSVSEKPPATNLPNGAGGEDVAPVHEGVFCDGCKDGKPIIGNRWKCTICEDFDLCDKCYAGKLHEAHEMQLIPKPDVPQADQPKGPTHENVACDACNDGKSIVGTRWKCQICANYDLCDNCHSASVHSNHPMLEISTPADAPKSQPLATHSGVSCDGCQDGTDIVGNRWKCVVCGDYDLCDSCNSAGIHDHQMLKIEHPADALSVQNTIMKDETDTVLLGFRVYSKSNAPVQIAGQLSNRHVIRWKKEDK